MFLFWLLSVFLAYTQVCAKLLHRELVSAPNNPIPVCINSSQADDDVISALVPIIRFNLNLSGLISVKPMIVPIKSKYLAINPCWAHGLLNCNFWHRAQ